MRLVPLALLLAACRAQTMPAQVMFEPPARAPAGLATTPIEPAILSAQVGAQGEILVVFSHEVDPASVDARGFLLAFDEGARVFPTEAVLSPSNESDENRTVLLTGEFKDEKGLWPTDVMVVGPLYAESGGKLQGLAAPVTPTTTAGGVVLAQRLAPQDGACSGAAQAVRTYWSVGLRAVDREDLGRIDITLDDATTVHPVGFDDHRLDDQSREDNVLDLCLSQQSPAQRIVIAAALFTDPAGQKSASVEQTIISADAE